MAAEFDDKGRALLAERRPTEAAEAFALAQVYETAAEEMERLARLKDLPGKSPPRTLRTMDIDTRGQHPDVKRGAGRATRNHPAQQKFYAAGVTIKSVAKDLRETRARVSSWMADGEANRPIPRRYAEYLKERYGVPLSAWARIKD